MTPKREEPQLRTPEQLREHYLIEKDLAKKLRYGAREERRRLYPMIYDELYQRVPLHPLLTRKKSPEETRIAIASQMRFLNRFLLPDQTFLEVGAGDCALSLAAAQYVRKVYAIDVSTKITGLSTTPQNFQLVISDGVSIDVPSNSITLAYSNQLMEHLHPDDAIEQLENIFKALAPGGRYVCITPNCLGGPCDISRYFDDEATGLHLREYTVTELSHLFRRVGFPRVSAYLGIKGIFFKLPLIVWRLCEAVLGKLPNGLRRRLTDRLPLRLLMDIRLVGQK